MMATLPVTTSSTKEHLAVYTMLEKPSKKHCGTGQLSGLALRQTHRTQISNAEFGLNELAKTSKNLDLLL